MHKSSPITRTICTYLQDFSLLGGIMALAEPSGLMQPYVTLTVHGLTWHLILIFIGLYCHRCGLAGKSWREYAKTLPLLAVFLAFASIINVVTHGQADMFYISPFYPVTQVFFYQVSLAPESFFISSPSAWAGGSSITVLESCNRSCHFPYRLGTGQAH